MTNSERVRRWKRENPGAVREQKRRYRLRHPEKKAEEGRRWRLKNPEKCKEHQLRYYYEHREEANRNSRLRYARLRDQCLEHYGRACSCCGEKIGRFLTIDHINGGGTAHRKTTANIWRWLVKHNFPEDFQVLCYNCNCGRALNGGICPHKIRE